MKFLFYVRAYKHNSNENARFHVIAKDKDEAAQKAKDEFLDSDRWAVTKVQTIIQVPEDHPEFTHEFT
jgi:hypothetical protein